jgi:CBS domain containing-hemolysin-like protein
MNDTIIFLVLISLSALFSGAETALFSLHESQIRLMVRKKTRNAHIVSRLKKDPQRLLASLLIANNVVNLSIASYATVVAYRHFETMGSAIATGISIVVVILWGEIIPKTIAFRHKERFSQVVAPTILVLYFLCYPVTSIFVFIERFLQKKFHGNSANLVSEEEIRIMAELGLEHGEIDHAEQQMIEKIFQFDDITVGQIATPKERIESLNGEVPVEQIAYFVSQSGFSRFPVYDGNPNVFIGYVHTNDVMRVLNSDDRDHPIVEFAWPLGVVSAALPLRDAFRFMTKERVHIYLVHDSDDKETIIGMVTMEDILEEIMGDIEDERDGKNIAANLVKLRKVG